MIETWKRFRGFEGSVRLLMINQLTINTAFYMLMPYLAFHLTNSVGMAVWAVGLVLGMRNLAQQGMFLVGGTIADRLGYKPAILAGCALRTVGFAALGFADSLPVLLLASAATGFAGALFNPAVRAYLAADAGPRRVEAFALFNVFYQTGILVGPLIGMALIAVDFRVVAGVAAALFLALTVLQARALPARHAAAPSGSGVIGVLGDWRGVLANRGFVVFTIAMAGSYVLNFQIYLALPLTVQDAVAAADPGGDLGSVAVASLFGVSALVAIAGQVRITDWAKRRWDASQALPRGLTVMAVAFLPMLAVPPIEAAVRGAGLAPLPATVLVVVPAILTAALLGLGGVLVYPFEMDTVVRLSGDRLVATHYGLYNTVSGLAITGGNLAVGAMLEFDAPIAATVPWLALAALGAVGALGLVLIGRAGGLASPSAPDRDTDAEPAGSEPRGHGGG
ncbi:MFS transporter [Nocardiopsis gilva YIM 90087]|uniref:MFS transporter n=1 Tax=Nocardiopsis gilva YIM 90087 TaxID=1235441 RepID=A0A223SCK9_9ACTN|nr:MFS transporter [Nocardiopsis gilva]ASU85842.1 MFS transporter [Nocardiopsis gilva YIM 90087]